MPVTLVALPFSRARDDPAAAGPPTVRPDELERRIRGRLDALGPAPRGELFRVLMLPDFERADRIGRCAPRMV
jgi:hypothetical protein